MKLLCRILQLLVLIPCLAYSFPTTAVLDNFNRANQDPIAGVWTNFPQGGTIGCRVVTNQMIKQAGTPGDGCYITNSFDSTNQEIYVTLPSATTHATTSVFRLMMCLQTAIGTAGVDGYLIEFEKEDAANDLLSINTLTNGVNTQLGAIVEQEVDNNDKLGAERLNNGNINLWFDDAGGGWTNLFTRVDATYSCGNTHIGVMLLSLTYIVDDFGGGNGVVESISHLFKPIQFK